MGSRTSSTSASSPFNSNRLRLRALALSSVLVFALGTAALAGTNPRRIPPPPLTRTFIVLMENRNYTEVVGNTTDWPYFNSLISHGALVTNGFATGHPSIDNYFELTVGTPITHKDGFNRVIKNKNVVDALNASLHTWKVYAEDLPNPPTADAPDPYEKHHNPFEYFSDVVNDPVNQKNVVDFSQLATDESGTLPDYGFVVPNDCNDGAGEDSGSPGPCAGFLEAQNSANADKWLSNNIPGILNSLGSTGVLIITWDESNTDRKHGGGRVATLLLGTPVKVNYMQQTKNVYTQGSILRLMLQALGTTFYPGASRGAAWMGEFFQ